MEEVRLIYSVDKLSNLRSIVKQDLRELSIKVPKLKKSKKLNQSRNSQDSTLSPNIFGNYLSLVPSKYVSDCGFVPTFLVEASEIIAKQRDVEGIFRKSGSICRQKELKQQVEEGGPLRSENVHDVTGVVKQFFRELPEPLFTSTFHDSFVRCYHLEPPKQIQSMLLLCLMLPMEHLSTLRFTMKLLSDLAARCAHNKMDVGNLAVVLAPNIMHVNSRSQKMNSTEEKLLQLQTAIVGLLMRNAGSIGVVSDSVYQRTALMTECFGTEDELEASDDNILEDSKDAKEPTGKKTRKRSNSLQEYTREVYNKFRKRRSSLQGFVSSIGRGLAKLRRSTDGSKGNTSAACSSNSLDQALDSSEAAQTSQAEWLSVTQPELSLPPQDQPMATPVLMRKRKMSSGETVPFSATKRKAILDQLPHKSALGATPFTPASSKKRGNYSMLDTPSVSMANKSQLAPEATPKQDGNKSLLKKINLFSPATSRKTKRCKSQVASCSGGLRKSARTKQLFRRLSGGKDRDEEGEEKEDVLGVPQSQSAMELSGHERAPPQGLTRTVSSPSLHEYSSSPPSTRGATADDKNPLNQGFIDPDVTLVASTSSSQQAGATERGRALRRVDSKRGHKTAADRRSSSADVSLSLRRGQPNAVNNGLLEGRAENVKKLRRSFDKSDIGRPIRMVVPAKDAAGSGGGGSERGSSVGAGGSGGGEVRGQERPGPSNVERPGPSNVERPGPSKVERPGPSNVERPGPSNVERPGPSNVERPGPSNVEWPGPSNVERLSQQQGEQSMDMESSLLNVLLPPPSGFNDQSMMELSNDENLEGGSDQESEAGFSTISGGTVIHRPPGQLSGSSFAHYGSSVSVTGPHPPFPLQPSVSKDSLISTGSESSQAGARGGANNAGAMNRSASVDSGKGSLADNADTGSSRRPGHREGIKSSDLETARVKLEGGSSVSLENLSSCPHPAVTSSLKSVSAEDLKTARSLEKPPTRSHSMYMGGSGHHHPNVVPNLQISAKTHSLLARAGFLENSLPPNVKDVALPLRSPQRGDSSRLSFRREQRHQCSFRLEKSATFRKDRSSVLFAEHPTPVKEESRMEVADTVENRSQEERSQEERSQSRVTHQEHEPMEEDDDDTRTAAVSSAEEPEAREEEEVWVKIDKQTAEPGNRGRERRREDAPRSSISLKRAEMRMQKHESVVDIKESQVGRVAQSVQQFNSSQDQSTLDQPNASLHFQQCTTRKRGFSPIRIPTIFAKHKADASSAHYQELAHKYQNQKRAERPDVQAEPANKNSGDRRGAEEQKATHHRGQGQREEKRVAEKSGGSPKKGRNPLDLGSMETIKEVATPGSHKRPAAGHPVEGSRSPLRESTNTKSDAAVPEESVQLRTSKGLTPHQVLRYGAKVATSQRSPGKPVKRLNSPRSPHAKRSPLKAKEGKPHSLESHHFHEQY